MVSHSSPVSGQALLPDEELVELAKAGDAAALDGLLRRHLPWVYNLALYMLHSREDAADASQEILIKGATQLASFRGTSSFRTWFHRVAVNHILDRRKSRAEQVVTGFACYSEYLDRAPDSDPSGEFVTAERALLVEEARLSCTMGMLLCLDREQRMVLLLGEILDVGDAVGAELLGLTRDNFRQRLSRARAQLGSFMQGRCGLIDPNNACRCARKTRSFVQDGIVDPARLQFVHGHVEQVRGTLAQRSQRLVQVQTRLGLEMRELYPTFEPPDCVPKLREIIQSREVQSLLDLDN